MRRKFSPSGITLLFAVPAMLAFLVLAVLATLEQLAAQVSPPPLSGGFAFSEQSGEALYANVCQACHMPDGKGATGAGTYPSLAGDKALEAAGYPVFVVVNGHARNAPGRHHDERRAGRGNRQLCADALRQ